MAYTNITYNNPQKQSASKVDNSNRFKINEKMLAMMAKNPTLGIGYIIGSMLGENYWGRKRNKSTEDAVNDALNQNGQLPTQQTGGVDWDQANKILDAYVGGGTNAMNTASVADAMKQQQGWFVPPEQINTATAPAPAAGVPQTPQQANAPAITLDNAGAMGGVPTNQDAWAQMQNSAMYNNGNTGLFTNGVRNLDNAVTTGNGQNLYDVALNEVLKNPPTKQYFVK